MKISEGVMGSRVQSWDQAMLLGMSTLVGLIGGLLAVGYYHLVKFLRWFFNDLGSHSYSFLHNGYVIAIPVGAGLLIGLLNYYFTSDARSSYGLPGVIEAIGLRGGRIRPRIVVARSLAAAVCVGGGGAAGKQGSIVQMGLEVGSVIGEKLGLSEQRLKLMVICGVAAMIGANYNSPLGGAILVFEVIMGEFNLSHFSLVMISSSTAALVYRSLVDNAAKFTAPAYTFKNIDELPIYVLLGILCGLLGVLYMKIVFQSEAVSKKLRSRLTGKKQLVIPMLGGLVMGLITYMVPLAYGRGTQGIDQLLTGKMMLPSLMILLLVLKLCTVALTMGTWGTGGGYRAGLFTGAMLGGALGVSMHYLTGGATSPSATYALVGMAGAFGGFAQAPLTGIVMMSEMTKDYHLIIPLAITSVIAAYTSRMLTKETLYTAKLIQRGLDVANARRSDILKNLLIKDFVVTQVETLPYNMNVRDAYTLVAAKPYHGFPVVDEHGSVLGITNTNDIRRMLRRGPNQSLVLDVMTKEIVTISIRDTLQDAIRRIHRNDTNRLLVVDDTHPGKLVGIITLSDIIGAYDRDIEMVAGTVLAGKGEKNMDINSHITSATEVSTYYYNLPEQVRAKIYSTTGEERESGFLFKVIDFIDWVWEKFPWPTLTSSSITSASLIDRRYYDEDDEAKKLEM